jgi:hypothetical protein
MGKTVRTMSIESEVWEHFQKSFPGEASSFCEESMRKRIQTSETDISGISQDMLAIEESTLQKALDDLNSKMMKIKETKEQISQSLQEAEIRELLQEKERIESMGKCEACGKHIGEESKKIMIGTHQFCKECFFNEHPTFIKTMKEVRAKEKEAEQVDKHS